MALVQFNLKAYQETIDLFTRLLEESDAQTKGKFFETLLENYQNPRKVDLNPENEKLIQNQKEQIEILTNQGLSLDEKNIQFETDCINLKEAYQKLLNEFNALNSQDITTKLSDDQVIMNLVPHVKFFVNAILIEYAKRSRPTTAGEMLKNLFWNYILRGPGDYLPVVYSTTYVRGVLEQFKKGVANGVE
jgi:predicted nuclease with TOPRIM domain